MKIKTVYVSESEIKWLEECYPECSAWGFDIEDFLNHKTGESVDQLYFVISAAHDEGFDKVKFEWNGGDYD